MNGFQIGDLNLKIPSILAISIFMSRINMLRRVDNENNIITSEPALGDWHQTNVPAGAQGLSL